METTSIGETRSRLWWGMFAAVAGFFLFRLWYMGQYQLVPDEAYYWSWSWRPAFCYYDQPGMTAWLGGLFTALFGKNALALRLAGFLLTLASTIMMYQMALALMKDKTWAMAAVLLVNFLPIFSAGPLLFIHDNCMMFFWTLACLLLTKIALGGGRFWWICLSFTILLALYSKFSAALIGPCILLFLLLSNEHRVWLKRIEPYLGGALVLVLFMPVIAWNMSHQWVAYLAVQKLSAARSFTFTEHLINLADYIGGQFLLFTPVVFAVGVLAIVSAFVSYRKDTHQVRLLYACLSAPLFAYFLFLAFRTKVQANWPMAGFVTGSLLAVDYVRRRWDGENKRLWRKLSVAGVVIAVLFAIVIHTHTLKKIVPLPEGKDITDQVYGWEELAARVEEELDRLGREDFSVMGRSYQTTSQLEFYLPGDQRPYCASYSGRGNQYDVEQDYSTIEGKNVLFVDENRKLTSRFKKHFYHVKELEPFQVIREGKVVRTHRLYVMRGFRIDGPFREYFVDPLASVTRRMREARLRGH